MGRVEQHNEPCASLQQLESSDTPNASIHRATAVMCSKSALRNAAWGLQACVIARTNLIRRDRLHATTSLAASMAAGPHTVCSEPFFWRWTEGVVDLVRTLMNGCESVWMKGARFTVVNCS